MKKKNIMQHKSVIVPSAIITMFHFYAHTQQSTTIVIWTLYKYL